VDKEEGYSISYQKVSKPSEYETERRWFYSLKDLKKEFEDSLKGFMGKRG
jgi:hypothetical protein